MTTAPWTFVRLGMAALIAAAVATQLVHSIRFALASGTEYGSHVPTIVANFFSFFTVESNIVAAVALAVVAVRALRGRTGREPAWVGTLFLAAATFMTITGLVYNTLLRFGPALLVGNTVSWANEVMHVVGPLFLLADALLARHRALPWGAIGVVLAYPIAWVGYTLLRAEHVVSPATGSAWWYPYPFLNPHVQGGYGGVALYVIGIAIAFGIVSTGILALWRRRARIAAAAPAAA
ncbi:Pr6Pr family membrane protein [Microbacterium halophytorum]|uniref:Pr6Pr family membrane protein n=1 Tax=Microbacterium halophytorum TaxID=2067568 RepID=UPI000CFD48EB|nr:Pr6Pr family membrane protein [Microbacterium halophytorum]